MHFFKGLANYIENMTLTFMSENVLSIFAIEIWRVGTNTTTLKIY